jgi:hypothetical protein
MILRRVAAIALSTAVVGCSNGEQEPEQLDQDTRPLRSFDDSALRRKYGPAEMKLHECARLDESGMIEGTKCPDAFVLFGPYIAVPASADLNVSFEIESQGDLQVISDVVSAFGKISHGGMDDQTIVANEKRKLAYRIHMFQWADSVEARLWVRNDNGTNFKISNLAVEVR